MEWFYRQASHERARVGTSRQSARKLSLTLGERPAVFLTRSRARTVRIAHPIGPD
jgi:hypothetical protein